jgi:GntR family transcriptional regulator
VKTPDPRAYVRLAMLLRDQLVSGMIAPGGQMPPIGELREKHGHSRETVVKAMRILEGEGLIHRVPGLGYYRTGDEYRPRSGQPDA